MKRFRFTAAAVGFAVLMVTSLQANAAEQGNSPCQNSTLTGVQFLDLVDTLASRGNLHDVPFTEALLSVTFEVDARETTAKRYHAKSLFGLPIDITLTLYPEGASPEFGVRLNGEINFQELPTCLGLDESDIEGRFRGAMAVPPHPPFAPPPCPFNVPAPCVSMPKADQPSGHEAGRDFRAVTGAYMRLADLHFELLRSRPVFCVTLSELVASPTIVLPPLRSELNSQPR